MSDLVETFHVAKLTATRIAYVVSVLTFAYSCGHKSNTQIWLASFPGSPGMRICIVGRAWYLFYVSMM